MQTGLTVGMSEFTHKQGSPLQKANSRKLKNPLDASTNVRAKGALSHMKSPLSTVSSKPMSTPLESSGSSSPLRASNNVAQKYRQFSSPLQNARNLDVTA